MDVHLICRAETQNRLDAGQAKHDELSKAGLSPGKVQDLSRGGSRVTTFYCNAPGGVVIEIATPPGLAAE